VTAKGVIWVGSSRADIRKLPRDARWSLGHDLNRVQLGRLPRGWRPMSTVGPGVIEIRVHAGGAFRLMYVAKFAGGIYVLHVFQKKSEKTSLLDLAVARARYAAVHREQRR
jgi:phage-related protein